MPDTTTSLTPHLCCQNALEAVDFYHKAFGAESLGVHQMPDGRVMHATLQINGVTFFVVDEFPEQGGKSPKSLGGTPVMLYLHVPDCDTVFQRAVDAGCEVLMPLEDQFWGDRYGLVSDPYGHQWEIATTMREVSPEELDRALAEMSSGG